MYHDLNGNIPLEIDAHMVFGRSCRYGNIEVSSQSRPKSRKREQYSLQKSPVSMALGKIESSGTKRITQVETFHESTPGNKAHVFSWCKLK